MPLTPASDRSVLSTVKRPIRRSPDSAGRITVSGGEWVVTHADGRSFVHASKSVVSRMARIYAAGGESAVEAELAAR